MYVGDGPPPLQRKGSEANDGFCGDGAAAVKAADGTLGFPPLGAGCRLVGGGISCFPGAGGGGNSGEASAHCPGAGCRRAGTVLGPGGGGKRPGLPAVLGSGGLAGGGVVRGRSGPAAGGRYLVPWGRTGRTSGGGYGLPGVRRGFCLPAVAGG